MARKTAAQKRASAERAATLLQQSKIPGALTPETQQELKTFEQAGPIMFYGTKNTEYTFLCPENEEQGSIEGGSHLRDEYLHSKGVEHYTHPPANCKDPKFWSQEQFLYVFQSWLKQSHDDTAFHQSKGREDMLKKIWKRLDEEPWQERIDDGEDEDASDQCVLKVSEGNKHKYIQKRIFDCCPPSPEDETSAAMLVLDMSIICKFMHSSNPSRINLKKLLRTRGRELVYTHPWDGDLGVGYTFTEALRHKKEWGGNALGKALMRFRDGFTDEEFKKILEGPDVEKVETSF